MNSQRGKSRGSTIGFKLTIVALLLALVGVAVAGGIGWSRSQEVAREGISTTTIAASFEPIAELSVEEYHYTDVGKWSNEEDRPRLFGFVNPLKGKNFILTYDGYVKAGIRDFSQITPEIDAEAGRIVVNAPKVEVVESHVNMDSVVAYDQSFNPFAQLEAEDFSRFFAGEEERAARKAVELGLLDRAQKRTAELLVNQVDAITAGTDAEAYNITVKWQ